MCSSAGEHYLHTVGVTGSNPVVPTIRKSLENKQFQGFLFAQKQKSKKGAFDSFATKTFIFGTIVIRINRKINVAKISGVIIVLLTLARRFIVFFRKKHTRSAFFNLIPNSTSPFSAFQFHFARITNQAIKEKSGVCTTGLFP